MVRVHALAKLTWCICGCHIFHLSWREGLWCDCRGRG